MHHKILLFVMTISKYCLHRDVGFFTVTVINLTSAGRMDTALSVYRGTVGDTTDIVLATLEPDEPLLPLVERVWLEGGATCSL